MTYLHHDQQGSTRLLTGSTGTVTGSTTFDAYGNKIGSTGTSATPLGYDGQYTSSDTGLIYVRARVYDPATAQFLTSDPAVSLTGAPYNFAGDNPLNRSDLTGLGEWEPWTESFWTEGNAISNSPLNPIPYYEKEIESYENGCGYLASVTHGLEGALAGATLFAGGEGETALGEEALANTKLISQLTPREVDELARKAGYEVVPGGEGYSNPATRYYVPGTNKSEGFRVLPEDVKGQPGLKEGPYLRYFGGANHGIGVPLSSG